MTHDELVIRAVRWLAGTKRCGLVVDELVTSASETPDAIGWRYGGVFSILVECKVSVSDFHADKRKMHRKTGPGMGWERWYMTPPGLLKPEMIPEGWGLVEADKRCMVVVKAPQRHERDLRSELRMLYSACLRDANDSIRVFAVPDDESEDAA